MTIPFTIYDFFGYLMSGYIALVAFDYAYDGLRIANTATTAVAITFWTVAAYTIGHVIASFSSALLERHFARGYLGAPSHILFMPKSDKLRAKVFSLYCEPLQPETQTRVMKRATEMAGLVTANEGLYFHCWGTVKKDPACYARLSVFLNLYGFARNVALAALISAVLVAIRIVIVWSSQISVSGGLYAALAASSFLAIALLFRYLKFYRQYAVDVYVAYAEG